MNIIAIGSEVMTTQSSMSITSTSKSVSSQSYNLQVMTYVLVSSTTSDVFIQNSTQSYSIAENSVVQITPNLTWSASGSTSIVYSTSGFLSSNVPAWINIDSSTGELNITSPYVSKDTLYEFYVDSSFSGSSQPVKKLIMLTILNCNSLNWKTCSGSNSSVWVTWNSGYSLSSGNWNIQSTSVTEKATENANKQLSSTTASVGAATMGWSVLAGIMNSSSIATLWMTINQLQIFFLLLLVGASIPESIKSVIKGSNFASNIYEIIPLRKLSIYPSLLREFEFELQNAKLSSLEINYDSTIANTSPILMFLFLICLIHIWICLFRCFLLKFKDNDNWFVKFIIWITNKVFNLLTFSFYIRNVLEISQFVFISTTNEIFEHNTSSTDRLISFIFTIFVVVLYVSLWVFIQFLIFSDYRLSENEHNKLGEFFSGLKSNKKSRFYLTLLLLRRFAFIALIITLASIPSRGLIGILLFIQLLYAGYIAYLRPYTEVKSNIIEIINELYFTLLIWIFLVFNEKDDWSSLKTDIWMWLLTSNTLISFLIIFSKKIWNIL